VGAHVVHIVREVVQMEEVSHEVVDDPKLRIRCIWITLSDKKTSFETVIRFAFLAQKVTVFEEPSLRLFRNLVPMSIATKFELAVRDQVRYYNLARVGGFRWTKSERRGRHIESWRWMTG
jgi:hypothetical protein